MAKNIFSEDRGIVDDVLGNAATVDELRTGIREDVKENVVQGGVLTMSDCPYCGLQWKGVVKWPEIIGFFLGQQVQNTQATQRGIALAFGCRKCNKISPMTISWDDLDRYVAIGVKKAWLPKTIYGARERVLAERAQRAAQQPRR